LIEGKSRPQEPGLFPEWAERYFSFGLVIGSFTTNSVFPGSLVKPIWPP
jgi:hypothetical protein